MIKELKALHRTIIQMAFNGFSNNEIAEQLSLSQSHVSQVLCSPLGKAYMNSMTDKIKDTTLDVRKELISMNRDALNTFRRLLDPKQKTPASVQFNTAKDILDRSGFKAPDKLNIDMTFQHKTDAEIDAEINALESAINGVASSAPQAPTREKSNSKESNSDELISAEDSNNLTDTIISDNSDNSTVLDEIKLPKDLFKQID